MLIEKPQPGQRVTYTHKGRVDLDILSVADWTEGSGDDFYQRLAPADGIVLYRAVVDGHYSCIVWKNNPLLEACP